MIIGDKSTRTKAIPFEALPFDEIDLNSLSGVYGLVSQTTPIRLTRPHAGEVVEAALSLQLHAAASAGFSLYLAIGNFIDADLLASQTYTPDYIIQSHKKLTGQTTPFVVAANGTLFIDSLSLLPDLPQVGDANYSDDGFVLVFAFTAAPTISSGYNLDAFRVTCSAQMGLL